MAKEDLRSVIGIYDASLGKQSNETSGKAILARQKEGDTGSYLYIDNFARAVRQTGNIINDLIPHVYDTERTIRIMGEDGKIDVLEINKAQASTRRPARRSYAQDITSGSYDVVTEMGPSYTTKRQEAREGMTEFVRAAPEAGQLILDKIAKARTGRWPRTSPSGSAMLPPKILQLEEMEKQGATPEQITAFLLQGQEAPPDPKLVKVQQDGQLAMAKLQQEQQQSIAELQLEMRRMAEESRRAQDELSARLQEAILKSNTSVEVAQITAGAGVHKTIVDATLASEQLAHDTHHAHLDRATDAALTAHDINTAAETARYQADTRPQPQPGATPAS
jgi:hypothetical protein